MELIDAPSTTKAGEITTLYLENMLNAVIVIYLIRQQFRFFFSSFFLFSFFLFLFNLLFCLFLFSCCFRGAKNELVLKARFANWSWSALRFFVCLFHVVVVVVCNNKIIGHTQPLLCPSDFILNFFGGVGGGGG